MNTLKKKLTLFSIIISFIEVASTPVYFDSNVENFLVKEAQAQSGCTYTCLTGLEKTSGPDGTFRRICEGFCNCNFEWVAYDDDFGTGSCSISTDPEEN